VSPDLCDPLINMSTPDCYVIAGRTPESGEVRTAATGKITIQGCQIPPSDTHGRSVYADML